MKRVLEESSVKNRLIAETWYSGFEKAHDTYNAISAAGDGKIYYILSSEAVDVGGKMYSFDPLSGTIKLLADLTEICGEKEAAAIVQGKSHVPFYEKDGELYFATHVGHYEMIDGMERMPVNPPLGIGLYPGGHFISYNLANGRFTDLGKIANGEGILTMTMDSTRSQLYAITWPEGHFIHVDLPRKIIRNLGPVSEKGEAGQPGKDYRVLCRSMFVEPGSGQVYYTNTEGDILFYDPAKNKIQKRTDVHLRLDYFGVYPADQPGSMGYNWRQIIWHAGENAAYGIHGNSGYLFRFDPTASSLELIERITSEPSRRSGMYDQFSYGYLGFTLDADRNVIYYLTGGPVYEDGALVRGQKSIAKGGAKGLENLHLVTYDLSSFRYQDHGPVYYADGSRPTYVNSIALDKARNIYTLARMKYEGKEIADLVRIRNPFG